MIVDNNNDKINPYYTNMAISAQERAHLKRTNGAILGNDRNEDKKPTMRTQQGALLDVQRGLKVVNVQDLPHKQVSYGKNAKA